MNTINKAFLFVFVITMTGCSPSNVRSDEAVNCIGYIKAYSSPKPDTIRITYKRGDQYFTTGKPMFLESGWWDADVFDKIECKKKN